MSKNIISNTPKSEHQLITEAVNAHGIFFKIAVRNTLEQIEGVTILGEEYPVRYMEGASLDLLVEFTTTKFRYIFPIECKRAYVANKRWLFFKDSENYSKILYCFTGKALNALGSAPFTNLGVPVCIEGIQVDLQEFQKSNASTYRTHLTSFAGVLGFEVSRYFAINNRACLTRLFFARTGIKPASCKAFSFRNRSQMGSIRLPLLMQFGKQLFSRVREA